ncbi:hypothetical protein B0T26DRAFT_270920 [Lasiosphaeria miniovina]|uniref:Uncharacterized protein n=1 Tax=Lasiosphaeria miniovina TaxID=1954250 RepID=A0AA40AJJ7_9PEZI|nr:uncharacterized protein B0T26DRAFT_270920 [Lasiosphaeria miniovina]KAK0716940.1 hypothetical protein B0T26DRAFT_270920 [Lasiosphaeria miniovina]
MALQFLVTDWRRLLSNLLGVCTLQHLEVVAQQGRLDSQFMNAAKCRSMPYKRICGWTGYKQLCLSAARRQFQGEYED